MITLAKREKERLNMCMIWRIWCANNVSISLRLVHTVLAEDEEGVRVADVDMNHLTEEWVVASCRRPVLVPVRKTLGKGGGQ